VAAWVATHGFELAADGDTAVLVAGAQPAGVAVLRLRKAIWSRALECYLAELYVVPPLRGQGIGRALMEAAIDLARARGADYMDLGTAEDDVAARRLYESILPWDGADANLKQVNDALDRISSFR